MFRSRLGSGVDETHLEMDIQASCCFRILCLVQHNQMLEFQKETERDQPQNVSPEDNKGGDLGSQTLIFHRGRKDREG